MIIISEDELEKLLLRWVETVPNDINFQAKSAKQMIVNTITREIINYNEKQNSRRDTGESRPLKFDS